MILNNLLSRMKAWFQTEKEYVEDKVWLEGLQVENKLDEAQAYAYVLSSIAAADGNFDQAERSLVSQIISEFFPGRQKDAPHLIANAEVMLKNFRTSESFIARIKEEYSEQERQRLYDAIDKVISSDGVQDGMESYKREKFRKALL